LKTLTLDDFIKDHPQMREFRKFTEDVVASKEDVTPKHLSPSILLSVDYDGKKQLAYVKLYDPKTAKIYYWYDNSDHRPYCLSDLSVEELKQNEKIASHSGLIGFEEVEKYDLLNDKYVKLTKIIAKDPLSIGGSSTSIREYISSHSWEDHIHYHHSYLMDNQLVPGLYYKIEDGKLIRVDFNPSKDVINDLNEIFSSSSEEFKQLLGEYAPIFLQPVPEIRRIAIDIEVYTPKVDRIPDSEKAEYPVIAVSLVSNDGVQLVLLLKRDNMELGNIESMCKGIEVRYFENERDLLLNCFKFLSEYPIVLTFNGDNFDLKYLWHRARKLGIPVEDIPIRLTKDAAYLNYGIHVDLYKFFHNRSIQIYAFSNKYHDTTLDGITTALLEEGKISLDKPITELNLAELAYYCWMDSNITLKLTTFKNNLVMRLIILLMRLSHLPMEDLTRQAVSGWIKALFYFEHRRNNYLIPRSKDILKEKGVTSTTSIIKGKKYKGAIVIPPVRGVHFNVKVLDFASLYPSIIKRYNLSYETIRCPHDECKVNKVPETEHWVCTKRVGIMSLIIGFLRDIRIKWFKNKAKDPSIPKDLRDWYSVVQLVLKVFLNASYGVLGSEVFPLYAPAAAESIASIGRYSILKTIEKAEKLGLTVLYSDTDSLFLKDPPADKIQELIKWSQSQLGIELDIDKIYRFVALSTRKKNYLGILEDGSVDIKGLTGKKRHVPPFVHKAFLEVISTLTKINSPEDVAKVRNKIYKITRECYRKLENREVSLEDLAFRVQMNKSIEKYTKTTPQHIKAASQLAKIGREVKPGDNISFVKIKSGPGVRPLELAKLSEVDIDKYKEYIQSTFEQILDAFEISFEEIIGLRKISEFL